MKQVFIDMVLTDRAAKAICWTLVHSIWQGVLAAALAAIVIAKTRRARAAIRYNLLTMILVLLVAAAGITFIHQLSDGGGNTVSDEPASASVVTSIVAGEVASGLPGSVSVMDRIGDYFNAHASMVVSLWLLCLTGQLLRLTGGIYQMHRFRRNGVHPAGDEWSRRLAELCGLLGVRKKISLLQSELVSMPVTFGFLKPTILIPLGMLNGLPADQMETILLHELAHIRRNDYLYNLLLYITESAFFFNPGLRWIATRIREEREACCDDIVLADTPNRHSYFDALIAFRERPFAQQAYPLQMGLGKTDLLWRIRRMLEKENKKLHVMEKAILSVGLMIILAIGLISMNSWSGPLGWHSEPSVASVQESSDTTPAQTVVEKVPFPSISKSTNIDAGTKTCKITATDAEGNTFQLTRINGEISEMVINGHVMAKEDFDRYEYIFEKIERHREARENAESDEAAEVAEQVEATEAPEATEATEATEVTEATEAPEPAEPAEQAEKAEVSEKAEAPAPPAPPTVADRWIHLIIKDLSRNGIIDHDTPLSFTLNKDGMTVNGVSQPDDVFRLFKALYVHNPKDHFEYSHDYGTTHVEVWVE